MKGIYLCHCERAFFASVIDRANMYHA
jgi:hypothetical protein